MKITTIFSTDPEPKWPEELDRLYSQARREPFSPNAIAFIGAVSQRILRSDAARQYPELAALAHWFRLANLRAITKQFYTENSDSQARPRGLVFAIAPANVDVLFVYAWFLSLLTGNATVVRVSQKESAVRELFFDVVRQVIDEQNYSQVLSDSWIVTYEHDAEITQKISEKCTARLVWGGDQTIKQVRSIFLNPLAVETVFADRFSLAAFDSVAVTNQSEADLRELARRFANDTLWFGQQACSSPRAILWIGSADEISEARSNFWPLYKKAANIFQDESAAVMSRVSDLFSLAAANVIDSLGAPVAQLPGSGLGSGSENGKIANLRESHSGYGLFVEYSIRHPQDILDYLDEKDQTLVVYGISKTDVDELVSNLPNRAIDRIVEPGQAMNFSTVWDGVDLLAVLTRKVNVSGYRAARSDKPDIR